MSKWICAKWMKVNNLFKYINLWWKHIVWNFSFQIPVLHIIKWTSSTGSWSIDNNEIFRFVYAVLWHSPACSISAIEHVIIHMNSKLGLFVNTLQTCLSEECLNVTVCYKLRRTFFTPKFDQIRPKIATFQPFFGFQNSQILLGIAQLINNQILNK